MPRYKIIVEYDGTGLAGWQEQDGVYSVQESLRHAVLKASGENVEVIGSGRTDAGVHALEQIAHFDMAKEWDSFRLKEAMNYYLRDDERMAVRGQVVVLGAEPAADDFHARFSAKKRYYIYKIINRRSHLALDSNRAWCVHESLDAEKMNEAAQILVGKHDFSSFRSSLCQAKSPVKTLDEIKVERKGELIEISCAAPSFMHHMVRNLTGTLRLIGNGKWNKEDLQAALDKRDRKAAGETAPAHGLYFVKVDY